MITFFVCNQLIAKDVSKVKKQNIFDSLVKELGVEMDFSDMRKCRTNKTNKYDEECIRKDLAKFFVLDILATECMSQFQNLNLNQDSITTDHPLKSITIEELLKDKNYYQQKILQHIEGFLDENDRSDTEKFVVVWLRPSINQQQLMNRMEMNNLAIAINNQRYKWKRKSIDCTGTKRFVRPEPKGSGNTRPLGDQ